MVHTNSRRQVRLDETSEYYQLEDRIVGTNVLDFLVTTEPVPLQISAEGVIRIGKTRVTLDTVVMAFKEGATAEEIVQQYPSLSLANTYFTIGYYLRHQSEVEAYLDRRRQEAERIQRENEMRADSVGIRERLLARRVSG